MYEQVRDAADERWYGVQEAAKYLGIHRATLFRALRSGLITADRNLGKLRLVGEHFDRRKPKGNVFLLQRKRGDGVLVGDFGEGGTAGRDVLLFGSVQAVRKQRQQESDQQ